MSINLLSRIVIFDCEKKNGEKKEKYTKKMVIIEWKDFTKER